MRTKLLIAAICLVLCSVLLPNINVSAQELEEYTGYVTDPEFRDVLEETISTIVVSRANMYSIDWTVPKKTRYTTNYFQKKEGSSIIVNIQLSSTGKVGIIRTNGHMTYVKGTYVAHTFDISEDSWYCVFVQNDNSSSITAEGMYVK